MRAGTLRPLYAGFGKYATVYLDTGRRAEDGAHAVELRWRAARAELADAGAREDTIEAIGEVLRDPALAAAGRAVFARDGEVAGTVELRAAPAATLARVAPLPQVGPALADNRPDLPHLRVSAARDGGEVIAFRQHRVLGSPHAPDGGAASRSGAVRAPGAWPVHKTSLGGWAQARYQRSAEHAWAENAKELAAHVAKQAELVGPAFILVAGDVRARKLLLDQLATAEREIAAEVDAEIAADSPELARAADEMSARLAGLEPMSGLDDWRALLGRNQAVQGAADTLAALRDGRAAAVFLGADPALAGTAWLGQDGTEAALTQAELAERGVLAPQADRIDEAIIRAAASTDADLFMLPADLPAGDVPKDGACASLRYTL